MHFHVLKDISTSLLEAYVEQVWGMLSFHPSMRLSHLQAFLIPLATWTPEIIQQEDGPESFGLVTSYSIEYGALQFFNNNSYEYCGPMDLCEEIVETATKTDIIRYRRFVSETSWVISWHIPTTTHDGKQIVPDWALPSNEPWVYDNRKLWVSPFHFYQWKLSNYSRAHTYPIHHNFVPEDDPVRMDTGDVYPKHGVWFYLQGFASTFPLVIPMSPACLPVDLCSTDFKENTIAAYCILPNFVHYLSSFVRRYPRDLLDDVSVFIDYYARMQPAYIVPVGTEFTKVYVRCGSYSRAVEGFWAQSCGNGVAVIAGDPGIPLEYMAPGMARLPGIRWAIECIYKQTMAKWFLHRCCGRFSSI